MVVCPAGSERKACEEIRSGCVRMGLGMHTKPLSRVSRANGRVRTLWSPSAGCHGVTRVRISSA
eukprot:1188555-Prorocentrum_minimum.AAC.3